MTQLRMKLWALLALTTLIFAGCGDSENYVFTNNGNPGSPTFGSPTALEFQTVPQRTAGTTFNTINVGVVDQNGAVVTTATNPITISLVNPNGAVITGTLTRNAVNGIASFNDLSVNLAGNYIFRATSPGLEPDESAGFIVTSAEAHAITFIQQPGNVFEGAAFVPDVQVEVRDALGNLVSATTVDIAIANNPGGTATLSGATQVTTTDGLATFTGLNVVGGSGAGFTLQASAGTAAATSGAFDVALNRIYTANRNANSITVHDYNADGDVAPLRTIVGAATGLFRPVGLAIVGNELICLGQDDSIRVYPLNGDGNVPPTRVIIGGNTLMGFPLGIVVHNNEIFVGNQLGGGSVTVYPLNGDGDIAPTRVITGAATGLTDVQGVAISNNELYCSDGVGSIRVFNVTDDGDVAPQRIIEGAMTGLASPREISIQGNELLVSNSIDSTIRVFLTTDVGDVAPQRVIGGAATGLAGPTQTAISFLNQIFVANEGGSAVRVFNTTDNGNVAPQRVISGPATGLNGCVGIAVGPE